MASAEKLVLVDLDHTLLSGDSDELWCNFLMDQGVLPRAEFEARNADIMARYKQGTVGLAEFANFYASTLGGRTVADWEPLRQTYLDTVIKPHLPQAARDLVRQHQDAGDLVVMTTATNRFLTERTAHFLSIEHLIATELEATNQVFMRANAQKLNMREGKVARLTDWLAQRGERLQDYDSTFYSDSINDLPLMLAVNHAVAVDPDPKLAHEAQARGWRVMHLAR